jgi:hypothetical protein
MNSFEVFFHRDLSRLIAWIGRAKISPPERELEIFQAAMNEMESEYGRREYR